VMFVVAIFVWILSLLLGRQQFWDWNSSAGFFAIKEEGYQALCQITTLFTFGVAQPLAFITLLFMIRSKTNASNGLDLYNKHPNRKVMMWSWLWAFPMIAIHLIIVGLNNASYEDPKYFWTTFSTSSKQCVVPLISTIAFTCFYGTFLVFYIFYSNKFSRTLINKRLRHRLWLSQIFFSLFFPFEVLLRFILTLTTQIQVAAEVLSHIFFFIDLIICLVGLLEFALFPVLDAAEFPLIDVLTDSLLDKVSRKSRPGVEPIQLDNISVQVKKPSSSGDLKSSSGAGAGAGAAGAGASASAGAGAVAGAVAGVGAGAGNNTTTQAPLTKSPSNYMPAYTNGSLNEQQSVEEFRKQMARYSSNV